MRILFLWILSLAAVACLPVATATAVPQPDERAPIAPQARHAGITGLVVKLMTGYHYRKMPLDNALSASILAQYLEHMDPNRSFLLRKDVDRILSRYGNRLDDTLREADITPAFEMFGIYKTRVAQRVETAISFLDGEDFTFTVDEDYIPDRAGQPWAASHAELDEIWRRRIKNDFLVLRLEDEKDDAAIRQTLRKRYETTLRHVRQFTADDICQLFLNAYASAIGPHTTYLSPRNSENLFIHLSLSLEGIGAVLQSDNEHTVVREIIAGGPADKSGLLQAEDVIAGVGQDIEGDMVDVIGWRLQDVVNLIRGPKDSIVRLKVLPGEAGPDGQAREIMLTRNRIDLADRAASSSVIKVPGQSGDLSIGVIELPSFYAQVRPSSQGREERRGTTRDVRRLIDELKKEPVAGIVLDLRGNSGGSLEEAINLTGLFLSEGPVVQVKKSNGEFTVKRDANLGMAWSGPLVVLVDGGSASASEILAGAIQDYKRGLVVGHRTHGKGTVQHLINLDDVAKSGRDGPGGPGGLGQFKITIAQFFRVNGESTQYRGVVPDIELPGMADSHEEGERALDNALPWTAVSPTEFSPYVSFSRQALATMRARHQRRVEQDGAFHILRRELAARGQARARTRFSLLEARRRAERKSREQARERREEQLRAAMDLEEKPDELFSQVLLREAARIAADLAADMATDIAGAPERHATAFATGN